MVIPIIFREALFLGVIGVELRQPPPFGSTDHTPRFEGTALKHEKVPKQFSGGRRA